MTSKIDDIRNKKTSKLSQQGYDCLADGDFDKAIEIAGELESLQYSAAFEIGATANMEMGDLESAIDWLRRGVKAVPQCWLNWQLLGNCLSDSESYREANEAYENAKDCPDAWLSSIYLNQAILANRQEHYERALELLEQCDENELNLHTTETRIFALNGLGRQKQAVQLAESVLLDWDPQSERASEDAEIVARIAASYGRVCLTRGDPSTEIRDFAFQSLSIDPNSHSLLALIREIDALYSQNASYYLITINCKLPEIHSQYKDVKGFFINYEVIADDPNEALNYIKSFEDSELQDNLLLERVELIEPCPDDAKGVFWRSGRIFYENEE